MTTESLNNVTSRNSVDGVTCENIGTDKKITPETIRRRLEEALWNNIVEQLMFLFNKNLESLKTKPLELHQNTNRIN